MGHVVLLGDSIFDNARYVPDRPPVIEQVRKSLPAGWTATLLAADGNVIDDISDQVRRMPVDATHLFVSIGGNDALGETPLLQEPACSIGESLGLFREVQERFLREYGKMLTELSAVQMPTTVCTIYDAIPGLGAAEIVALAIFNETILRAAFRNGLPVVDLRLVCNQASDYSHLSPIEPSVTGGAKIARVIAGIATTHDFSRQQSMIYS